MICQPSIVFQAILLREMICCCLAVAVAVWPCRLYVEGKLLVRGLPPAPSMQPLPRICLSSSRCRMLRAFSGLFEAPAVANQP